MDFESLLYTADDHEAGAQMRLPDKFGNETNLYILVKGYDSPSFKKAINETNRQILDGKISGGLVGQEARERTIPELISDWKGFENKSGEPVPFTKERMKAVLDNAPWLYKLIDDFIAHRVNFMKSKEAH